METALVLTKIESSQYTRYTHAHKINVIQSWLTRCARLLYFLDSRRLLSSIAQRPQPQMQVTRVLHCTTTAATNAEHHVLGSS